MVGQWMGNAKHHCIVKKAYLHSLCCKKAFTCASLNTLVIAFSAQPWSKNKMWVLFLKPFRWLQSQLISFLLISKLVNGTFHVVVWVTYVVLVYLPFWAYMQLLYPIVISLYLYTHMHRSWQMTCWWEQQYLVSITSGTPLERHNPIPASPYTPTGPARPGLRQGTPSERWGCLMEFQSRGREEAAGETMARDICHAWLHSPSLTMGLGDQPVVAFFSLPSFPGTLLALTMGLLSPPRFLPTFNPSSLLLFLPLLSASTRKQNIVENVTIHSSPSASVFHYDFWLCHCLCTVLFAWMCQRPSLYAACLQERVEREDRNDPCRSHLC